MKKFNKGAAPATFTDYVKFIFVCFICLTYTVAQSQQWPPDKIRNGKPFLYRLENAQARTNMSTSTVTGILGVPAADLRVVESTLDRQGFDNKRYQQYHNGIPVEHGRVSASSKDGKLLTIAGELYEVPQQLSSRPTITEAAALDVALAHVSAEKYKWEENPDAGHLPRGKLVFVNKYTNGMRDAREMTLAYKFDIYAVSPLARKEIFVDAHTGVVVFENALIKHAVEGQAHTRFSGLRNITTTFNAATNSYVLKDDSRGLGIETYNLNRSENYFTATSFSDTDNSWVEYDNATKDNAALDAHWGAMMTYDYFLQQHGRNSFDGHGAKIKSYVHYSVGYVNAFWDGSVMTYGDGDQTVDPLTSLDICAHEIGHAICSSTADLVYAYEPGALNESLSDIWAASVEHFASPEKSTWEIGEDINYILRSMSNPNEQGQPDTYNGDLWYTGYADEGGVHINSGVMNYWYYLLVVGNTGTNDHGLNYNVTGIGFDAAASIVYRMETVYLTPNSQYAHARNAALSAAADIFGEGSNEFIQTRKAWDAVGVYDTDAAPSLLTASAVTNNIVQLQWTDNSDNELSFIIERSQSPDSHFVAIDTVFGNTVAYTDENLLPGVYYYRVRAWIEDYATANSNVAAIELGVAPLAMTDGVFTVCNKVFLDPGGFQNYSDETDITMVVHPDIDGTKVSVTFSDFRLMAGDNLLYEGDYLEIFDGANVNAPPIGSYTDKTLPPQINATNASGTLTFRFRSDYSDVNFGWHATLSCVTIPSNLQVQVNGSEVSLTWQDDHANEAGYSIERKLVGNTSFKEIAVLPPNSTGYADTDVAINNLYEYRVRVQNGFPAYSAHSRTATATVGKETLVMRDGSYSICNAILLDPGGNGPYPIANFADYATFYTATLSPSTPGAKVSINFSEFDIESEFDFMWIYDGPSWDSPLIGQFSGNALPPRVTASNPEGVLTVDFMTDYSVARAGWIADVSCIALPETPGDLVATSSGDTSVHLSWTDNATDETSYIIERSTTNQYVIIATVGPDETIFDDVDIESERTYTYRLRALRDDVYSNYSNTSSVTIGNAPVIMHNGSVSSCDAVFMDTGGDEAYRAHENFTLTINPELPGSKVQVDFSMFDLENGSDKLTVYDGTSAQAPILRTITGSTLPDAVIAANAEGALTFQFSSNGSVNRAGWEARISCVSPPNAPGNLIAEMEGDHINLTWEDNSGDETGFIVERATGNHFVEYAVVDPDVESYADTELPLNRTIVYRVRAKRDLATSEPGNTDSVTVGTAPLIMHNGSVTTCSGEFLDPGGDENYGNENMTLTIHPDEPGKRVRIEFATIDLTRTADKLIAYNGSTVDVFNAYWEWDGNHPSPPAPAVVQATNSAGSLTFRFTTQFHSERRTGWVGSISCVDKGAPVITFADKTMKYVHPDDGNEIYLKAKAQYPVGNAFSYSIVDDPSNTAEVELENFNGGVRVDVIRTGTVKIKATIEENTYFLAGEKIMTLTILKGTRRIRFSVPPVVIGGAPHELVATIGEGDQRPDDFTFEVASSPSNTGEVILSGDDNNILTPVKAGFVLLKAVLAETDLYVAGEDTYGVHIRKGAPAILFFDLQTSIGGPPLELNATAYTGANFTYSVTSANSGAVTLSGDGNKTVTAVLPGTVSLKASLPETQNYLAAEKIVTLTVNASSGATPQFITFDQLPLKMYGDQPFPLTATASSTLPVIYQSSDPFTASVFGNMVTIHRAGHVTITAIQPGNGTFASATVQRDLFIQKVPVFAGLENATRAYGEVNPVFIPVYSGFIHGDDEDDLDVKPFGPFTLATESSSPGDYAIEFASLGSDVNYEIILSSGTLTITKASQSIQFDPIEAKNIYSAPFPLPAFASSGLPVSYTVTSGPATISGNIVNLTGEAGTVVIEAAQQGDQNYLAAIPVSQSFQVVLPVGMPQTISFDPLPELIYGNAPFQLTASASSSLPVTYTLDNNQIASLSGEHITILGAGNVTITARQSGNETFAPAAPVQRTLAISKKTLLAAWDNATRTYGVDNPAFAFTYEGFVNGDDENVLDIPPSGAFTTATAESAPGTYPIVFENSGTDNNYEITHQDGVLTITKASQSIAFSAIEDRSADALPFSLEGSASSGLPVVFNVVSGPASIAGTTLTLSGDAGLVVVEASQPGDQNYVAADPRMQSFTVLPATITEAESLLEAPVEVWPNPVSTGFFIKSATARMISVTIVDVVGKLTKFEISHRHETYLDVSRNPQGVYIMIIDLENGVSVQERVVIVR